MGENIREASWFAFSLVLAYYAVVTINFVFELMIMLLKVTIAESVVQ